MLRRVLPAICGALLLGASSVGISAVAAGTANPWNIGDVFLGIGDNSTFFGTYRGFTPDGSQKTDPDLLDAVGTWTTGCAVDPTVSGGDLYSTSFTSTVSLIPNALPHSPATGIQFFDNKGSLLLPLAAGVSPLPSNASSWLFESVTFDNAGNMFLGAQIPPADATSWTGYGWIVKLSKPTATTPATILGWWQVDAGLDTNPTKDPTVSQDIHGVDWLDLSKDQTTIYYSSEDNWIRSFHVAAGVDANGVPFAAGTQGARVQVHPVGSTGIGGKVYAIRIISPGDPANGFLVATTAAVYRVDATGAIIRGYFDTATTGYFALNITPDGASFWTATLSGKLYRFHIASGAIYGPFATGAPGALGLCLKREYTAAQNLCFATDPAGYPVPSATDPTGYQTQTCTLPPLPNYCAANPTDPACEAPGTPTITQPANLTNYEGDVVSVQLRGTDPWGQPLTWSFQNLPMGMDASYQLQPLQVSSTGLITGTLAIHDSAASPYQVVVTATNTHGQSASAQFTWTVNTRGANAPPTLTYSGGTQSLTDGWAISPAITLQAGDLDLDTLVVSAAYTRYTDATFSQAVPGTTQSGLLPGLSMPTNIGGSVNPTWLVTITGAPQILGSSFPQYYGLTITVYDSNGTYDHNDPTLYQLHHVSATVPIVINNLPPTFSVADQMTIQNTPVSYTGMKASAIDPDGVNPSNVTFALAAGSGPLPTGLSLASDGTVAGTPTQYGVFPMTVRATDVFGAFTDHAFKWTIDAPPVLALAPQLSFVGRSIPGYQISATDPDSPTLTYAVSGLPAGLTASAGGMVTGTPTAAALNPPATVTVTVTDPLGASATGTFTWTIDTPPTLVVSDKITLLGTPVSYQIAGSDPDFNQSLAYTVAGLPGGLTCVTVNNVCTGLITGTANVDNSPTNGQTVTVTVTDPFGASVTGSFRWLVTPSQPVCTSAVASVTEIWPPNHQMVPINVLGIYDRDPRVPFTIRIDRILQDEPTNTVGDGNTQTDGLIAGATAWVRAERIGTPSAPGNGRVYEIQFTAIDRNGATCSSHVFTGVPHDQRPGHVIVDDGVRYDSTVVGGAPVGVVAPVARFRQQ